MKKIIIVMMLGLVLTGCKTDKASVTGKGGAQGIQGEQGIAGTQLTLTQNNDGITITSEEETVTILNGDKGDKGDSIVGSKGDKGDKGDSITGPKGDKGDKGDSIVGSKGDKGDKGTSGDDGLSSIIRTERKNNCAYFYVGLDLDSSQTLEENEVTSSSHVCDGKKGDDGDDACSKYLEKYEDSGKEKYLEKYNKCMEDEDDDNDDDDDDDDHQNCNNGNGNGSEGCSSSENGNDDED